MEAVDKFQSKGPVGHEDAIKAAAQAAHCVIAPEGVCPAYTALRKLSAVSQINSSQLLDQVVSGLRGCPSARLAPCPALELVEDLD